VLRAVPRGVRPLELAPGVRRDRDADVRPDRDDHRSHRHVRRTRRRGDGRVPVAASRARTQVHAVRRAPRGALQDHRVALRSAAQGARLRLRDVLPCAEGDDRQQGGHRGAAVKYVRFRSKPKFDIWPVVYIDLMTQIMMFFVVLWAISQMQGKKKGVSTAVGDTTIHEVTLPGDVLFPSGKTKLTPQGEEVFAKLFADDTGEVLTFETGGLTKRVLVIHGHTDSDGRKDDNYILGFQRAMTVYKEIQKYGPEIDRKSTRL